MSDDETTRLEREIAERTERLRALRKPMTHDEAMALVRSDPDEFNRRWDRGLIPASALVPTKKAA